MSFPYAQQKPLWPTTTLEGIQYQKQINITDKGRKSLPKAPQKPLWPTTTTLGEYQYPNQTNFPDKGSASMWDQNRTSMWNNSPNDDYNNYNSFYSKDERKNTQINYSTSNPSWSYTLDEEDEYITLLKKLSLN